MFSFSTIYQWLNVRQYITKNKQYKKKKNRNNITETMYPMNTQQNYVLGLLYAITMEFLYGLEQ